MIFLTDKYNNVHLIGYTSVKSLMVVISVLGEETFALAGACDAAIILQHELKSILNKTVKITMLTDSATLFNVKIRYACSI